MELMNFEREAFEEDELEEINIQVEEE